MLLAVADMSDPYHERCMVLLDEEPAALVTTALVIAETGWLIERQLGPLFEARFYRGVARGELVVEALSTRDWERIVELTEKYADNGLGGVDSSLIAVAERLRLDRIATLDHRHFHAVRPKHIDALRVVP